MELPCSSCKLVVVLLRGRPPLRHTALGGRLKASPELVEQPLPLRARIAGGLTTAGMLAYTSSLIPT
ncbi:MAG: hypothetical protein M3O70_03900 [Actinomycetota bacterium]|nr:hypothetical protein [Actinomycetota bacterium]